MTQPSKGAVGLTGYPTPDNPEDMEAYLLFYFPDRTWAQYILGACKNLQYPYNWYKSGEMSVDEAAEAFRVIVEEAPYNLRDATVPTPFWDEESGDDADDEQPKSAQPWYGQLQIIDDELTFVENAFIWVVAGIIVYAGLPLAAIQFVPLAQKFVVTVKKNPLGGIIRFLADAVEIGRVDTYSATDIAAEVPLALPASAGFTALDAPTFWIELLEDNPHELESVSMTVMRSRLSEADFSNPSQRYNEDTDTFQYSPDNGETWYDSPQADPRHSSIFRYPALETTDPQCDAAANMVKWIKDFIDGVIAQLENDAQAIALTNDFLTRFATLFPPALLLVLLEQAASTLFDLGASALDAAFTSTQYDLLLCAFDCNISADGQVTAGQLTDIEVQIAATMDSVPAAIVDEILFIQGEVGLSNAGAIGGQTGDCSDCNCLWCHTWNFRVASGSAYWAADSGYGTWVLGSGWESQASGLIVRNFVTATTFRRIDISGNAFSAGVVAVAFNLAGVRQLTLTCSDAVPYTCGWDIDVVADEIILNPHATSAADAYIFDVTIQGEGDSPYGADNC